jgi:hypothetical protein
MIMESVSKRLRAERPAPPKDDDGNDMVWSILDNAYVTAAYWAWVNGRSKR